MKYSRKILNRLGVAPENHGLLAALYFAFFASGVMSIMLGTLLPYIRDENALSYAQSGLLLSAHQLGNLLAVLAAGVLPYAIGRKKSTLITGAGATLGLALMVVARGPWPFLVAFAFTGAGRGTMSTICNAVISEIADSKAAALNLLHAVFAVGALLSPLLVFLCTFSADSGWKFAVLTAAALTAIAWIFLARSGLSADKTARERGGFLSFLKDRQLWSGTMILFFYLCAEASIIGWFVVYFRDTGALPALAARFTPTMLWVMIMAGRVACAFLAHRLDKVKLLFGLSVGVTLSFAGMLFSGSAAPRVVFLLCLGLTMGGIYPTTLATIRGTSSTAATGFIITTASLGAIIMPGIVGAVADSHGLGGGVATILAALTCMTLLALMKLNASKRGNLVQKKN